MDKEEMLLGDKIIDFFDDLFWQNKWEEVEDYMKNVDLSKLSKCELYAAGMVTKWAKENLPGRPLFLERLQQALLDKGEPGDKVEKAFRRYQ